jgi:hypothetical protein
MQCLTTCLLGRHHFARRRSAAHVTRLRLIEPAHTIHRLPVIPDDQVVLTPRMLIDELPLRRVLDQIANEVACFRYWLTHDGADVR